MRWSLPCVMVWGLPFWFQNCFCLKFWTLQNYATLWWKFWKIVGMLILIAQKKCSDALNTTQKTPALCNIPFLNKARKTLKIGIFEKMGIFGIFSWFIQERYIADSWGLFAMYSMHQDASFELSKSTFRQYFKIFIIRGDPCDFGGVKIYRNSFARSKIKNKNSFGIRRPSLTPWRMVEITSLCLVGNLIALIYI